MGNQPNTQVHGFPSPSITRELEALFLASLVHESPLCVVLADASGRFLWANEAAARLDGLSVEAHVGRPVREVVPYWCDEAEAMLRRVLQGDVVVCEVSGETPAAPGVTRYWVEQWFPVRGLEGTVVAVAATLLEITDQVNARAAVERTAEMRDRLIHLTSHELRGPLTNILGFARLALRRESIDEVREDLRIIQEQAVQMRERLEISVALSDPDGELESVPVDTQTVDLAALVEHELSMLRRTLPNMSIHLVRQGDAIVQSDPHLLREVLNSLLDNAAKYSGSVGVVTVRVAPTLSGSVIEVSDDGPGISLEQQSRLFEPGFRTTEALAGGIDGDGLGLYVANRLSKRLGGALSVVSDLGAGAAFFLHLPTQPPVVPGAGSQPLA